MPLSHEQLKNVINSSNFNETTVAILRNNLQYDDSEKVILTTINSLISNSQTRLKGFKLLNSLIVYCSINSLTEFGLTWTNYCLINTKLNLKELKFEILANIINLSKNIENYHKKFVANHLLDTLNNILAPANNKNEIILALICLNNCMQFYPSWFTNHRNKVEPFLLQFLENSNQTIVKEAAIGFLNFQQTGSAGPEGTNYTSNFFRTFKKLCATVHDLYHHFFDGHAAIEGNEKPNNVEPFTFSPVPSDFGAEQVLPLTGQKILNCLTFIEYFMIKKFPAIKQIAPKFLIDIINKGLSVHICFDTNVSNEEIHRSLVLNKIQIALMKCLKILIIGYSPHLLPFSFNISRLFVNVLKRTQTCNCFAMESLYHEEVYKILNHWLKVNVGGLPTQVQELLIPILMEDILPVKKNVRLINAKATRKFGKKQKSVFNFSENNENFGKVHVIDNELKEKKCRAALVVLRCLLTSTAITVKESMLKELYGFVIRTILDIQANRHVHPYTNVKCQLELYALLEGLVEQNKYYAPMHVISQILCAGMNCRNVKISQICEHILNALEKICQSDCPSYNMTEILQYSELQDNYCGDTNNDLPLELHHEERETFNSSEQLTHNTVDNVESVVNVLPESTANTTKDAEETVNNELESHQNKHNETADDFSIDEALDYVNNCNISEMSPTIDKIKSDERREIINEDIEDLEPAKKKQRNEMDSEEIDEMLGSFMDSVQN